MSYSIKNPYTVSVIEKGDLDVVVEVFKDDEERNKLVLDYMQAVYNFVGGIGSEQDIEDRQMELDIYDNVYEDYDPTTRTSDNQLCDEDPEHT